MCKILRRAARSDRTTPDAAFECQLPAIEYDKVNRVWCGPDGITPTYSSLMSSCSIGDITSLLRAWSAGDRRALNDLIPLVYKELHLTAQRYMERQSPDHLLQSTALVNELYLNLVKVGEIHWHDRGHFFAVCAQIMRRTLTDYARSRLYSKRGGGVQHVPFEEWRIAVSSHRDLVALDDALRGLARIDTRKSQVVELRIFAGMSLEETAEALEISIGTVKRDWKLARSWLLRELDRGTSSES
jgi:RNA polymerase sigma factor (TIGR02999 family)